MKILQRDLNRSTFVVWEMKRNVSVVKLCLYVSKCVCSKIIEELPGLVGSGTLCITLSLKNSNYNYQPHLTLSFAWNSELFNYELSRFPFISEINRHYWARDDTEAYYEPANCWNYLPENHWSVSWKWTTQRAESFGRNCWRHSWISKLKISAGNVYTSVRKGWKEHHIKQIKEYTVG